MLNTSGSTFHDVEMEARIDDRPVAAPIRLRVLPPGDLFVRLHPSGGRWEYPVDAGESSGPLRPLAVTAKWSVTRVSFADNRNQLWTTDDHAVLRAE